MTLNIDLNSLETASVVVLLFLIIIFAIKNSSRRWGGALIYFQANSANFCRFHILKSLRNILEIESHASECMPEMTLQEEECKVKVSVGKPCPCSVGVVG